MARVTDLDPSDGISPWEMVRAEQLSAQGPEHSKEAVEFLNRAAGEGSLYALEALGRVMSLPPFENKLQAEAYYKAAELRGNWAAAMRMTPYQLSDQEAALASMQAQQVVSNFDQIRAAVGLPPLKRDVRPGLKETLDVMTNAAR